MRGQQGECLDYVAHRLRTAAICQADADHALSAECIFLVQQAEILGNDSSSRVRPTGASCSSLHRLHLTPLALRLRRHCAHFHQSKASLQQSDGSPPVSVIPWGETERCVRLQPAHNHSHVGVLALEVRSEQVVSTEPQNTISLRLGALCAQNGVPQLLVEAVNIVERRQEVDDASRCHKAKTCVVDAILAGRPALRVRVARHGAQLPAALYRLHLC
mmetsp:Transcript_32621/g.71176  ORF Transcript_32621/g.71176 Transcript_32621/m.71176 type:complete len:217 (+) Transcript_32621:677-1327(+)